MAKPSGARSRPLARRCSSGQPLEGGERSFFFTDIAGTAIRLAVTSRGIVWDDVHGQPARFTFSVASSLEVYEAQIASFRQQIVGWFVGLALLLIATLALLLRWLLKPVRRLEREIKEVEAGSREQLGEAWPRELAAVTSNLNALLEGERSRIKRYRDTLGNLAHSLKTPLAVMRQALGGSPDKERSGALNTEIDRMSGIIEHQMKRAAASGGVLLGQAPVDVAPIVTELRVALLRGLWQQGSAVRNRHRRRAASSSAIAPISPSCWATCWTMPASGRARISALQRRVDAAADSRTALRLTIEDDGPGIAEADRAHVLTRGGRADEDDAGIWPGPGHGSRHRGACTAEPCISRVPRSAARASSSSYPAARPAIMGTFLIC